MNREYKVLFLANSYGMANDHDSLPEAFSEYLIKRGEYALVEMDVESFSWTAAAYSPNAKLLRVAGVQPAGLQHTGHPEPYTYDADCSGCRAVRHDHGRLFLYEVPAGEDSP